MFKSFVVFRINLRSFETNFTAVFMVAADVSPKLIPVLFLFLTHYLLQACMLLLRPFLFDLKKKYF